MGNKFKKFDEYRKAGSLREAMQQLEDMTEEEREELDQEIIEELMKIHTEKDIGQMDAMMDWLAGMSLDAALNILCAAIDTLAVANREEYLAVWRRVADRVVTIHQEELMEEMKEMEMASMKKGGMLQ